MEGRTLYALGFSSTTDDGGEDERPVEPTDEKRKDRSEGSEKLSSIKYQVSSIKWSGLYVYFQRFGPSVFVDLMSVFSTRVTVKEE